jgi:hypothetical protein
MALNTGLTIKDLEKSKFIESPTRPGFPAIEVVSTGFTAGTDYDTIDVTYPTSTQEVYTFNLLASVVRVITVDYTTSSKKVLLKVTYV